MSTYPTANEAQLNDHAPQPPRGPAWPTIIWGLLVLVAAGITIAAQLGREEQWRIDWTLVFLGIGALLLLVPLLGIIGSAIGRRRSEKDHEDLPLHGRHHGDARIHASEDEHSAGWHSGPVTPPEGSGSAWVMSDSAESEAESESQTSRLGDALGAGEVGADTDGEQIGEQDGRSRPDVEDR